MTDQRFTLYEINGFYGEALKNLKKEGVELNIRDFRIIHDEMMKLASEYENS